ncbi:MAG: DUF2087 domain-containing protein [Actinomycetota bacterium]|nr:DUF2087 domain-containing protein [Actinomycetota bacterium]
MLTPNGYLRLALDPLRMAVLGRAVVAPVDLAHLAGELEVPPRRVLQAAGRLREAGLLDEELRLDRRVLQEVASALPRAEPPAEELVEGDWTTEEATVLARFFSGSQLTQIPSQRSKRRLVLERLVQEFEPGLRYSERHVNSTLQVFHPDYASLRRFMVDEGLLTRAEGVYWRTGGRVDLSA